MAERRRIESVDNAKVKEAVRLRDRRGRRKAGRFLVEGLREIVLALEAGLIPELLFVEEAVAARSDGTPTGAGASAGYPSGDEVARAAEERGGRVVAVSPAVWAKLAVREDRDGLLGVFPIPDASPARLRLPPEPLVLAATGIEKPGNLGALLRSADAFGADAFVVEGGTDLWNPNVVRASLGTLFTVPVAAAPAGSLRTWLAETGLRIVAATPRGESLPAGIDLRGPVALLLGSEEHGLDEDAIAGADARVRIPMRGKADSLNVSVSAGVLLYEADRQRSREP
jgi:TrmH family RNA methyltransferase